MNDYYEKETEGNTTERLFIMAGGTKVATVTDDSTTASTTFHHPDHLTGANVTTDDTGAVVELVDYYPYGSTRIEDKAIGYENDYLYTGQERDGETGLYYYGARYYDSSLGRFTSVDPWFGDISDPQSLNKYSYVRNNPLKYVDPSGEWFDNIVDAGLTAYDAAKVAVNLVQIAGEGINYAYGTLTGDVQLQQEAAAAIDKNTQELAAASADLAIDAAASAIPFASAAVTRIDDAAKIVDGVAGKSDDVVDVYRVYGGDAKPLGQSWTPENPNSVDNFRDTAGLPNENTGRFVIEGQVNKSDISTIKPASALDGNKGGLTEYVINDPSKVDIKRVSGANPEF